MATITGITGATIDPEKPLDGVNLVPYLLGEKKGKPHKYLFWRKWEQNAMAIRHGSDKIVAPRQWENKGCLFYDLDSDIEEADNLINNKTTIADKLIKRWEKWNSKMKDRAFPALGNDNWWER